MKYQFITHHRHEYPVTIMCRVLEESVSGYYAWSKRPPSQHSREDAQLAEHVKTVFQTNRRVDGSPRVHAELQAQGMHCARKRVARLMREQGLFAQHPPHRTITTKNDPARQWLPTCFSVTSVPVHPPPKSWPRPRSFVQRKRDG